jgi:hypothetical protein
MENDYICYECDGEGQYYWKYTDGNYYSSDNCKHRITCNICHGTGRVNWIENIFHTRGFSKGGSGPVKVKDVEK